MRYEDIVEAILILIGPKATQDIIDRVYFEVTICRVNMNGGFAHTVAQAAELIRRNSLRLRVV